MKYIYLLVILSMTFGPTASYAAGVNGMSQSDDGKNWTQMSSVVTPKSKFQEPKDLGKAFAPAPFAACENISLVDYEEYAKNKSYWDAAKTQCASQIDLEFLPQTGFTKSDIRANGSSKIDASKAVDFLQQVANATREHLNKNIKVMMRLQYCLKQRDGQMGESCKALVGETKAMMTQTMPELREKLALVDNTSGMNSTSDVFNAVKTFCATALLARPFEYCFSGI